MRKETKEIVKLNSKEFLLSLVDGVVKLEDIFDGYSYFRKSREDYFKVRSFDKLEFSQKLYRLKKARLINTFVEKKKQYIELTKPGMQKVKAYLTRDLKITKPKKWDKKWRVVIFDIPNDKKTARDVLASTLKRLGFLRLQKSVFVYPFACKEEIDFLKSAYGLYHYVQYIIADSIDIEKDLLGYFFDNKLLAERNITRK